MSTNDLPELILDLRRVLSPVLSNAIEDAVRDYARAAVAQSDEQIERLQSLLDNEIGTGRRALADQMSEASRLRAEVDRLQALLRRIHAWSETLWPGQADQPGSIAADVRAAINKATGEAGPKNPC